MISVWLTATLGLLEWIIARYESGILRATRCSFVYRPGSIGWAGPRQNCEAGLICSGLYSVWGPFVFLEKSFALVFSHPVVLHPPFRSILGGSGKGQFGGSAFSFYPQQAVITDPPFLMTCSPPLCSPNIPVQCLQISHSQWWGFQFLDSGLILKIFNNS